MLENICLRLIIISLSKYLNLNVLLIYNKISSFGYLSLNSSLYKITKVSLVL